MSNNIAAFTEACIDQNTVEELYFVYGVNGPDEMDMMTWGLSEEEWGGSYLPSNRGAGRHFSITNYLSRCNGVAGLS